MAKVCEPALWKNDLQEDKSSCNRLVLLTQAYPPRLDINNSQHVDRIAAVSTSLKLIKGTVSEKGTQEFAKNPASRFYDFTKSFYFVAHKLWVFYNKKGIWTPTKCGNQFKSRFYTLIGSTVFHVWHVMLSSSEEK